MKTNNLSQLLGLFLCFVGVIASLPLEQINSNEQTTLFRRDPMHGIFHSNVARNRVDIGMKAKGRMNDAGKLLRQGEVGRAIGHYVSGAIGQHSVMQGAIARGRAARQAYASQITVPHAKR